MYLFLLLTYCILPSTTTTIFQMFVCQNIDPRSEDSNGGADGYLTADTTIACDSRSSSSGTVHVGRLHDICVSHR